MTTLFFCLKNIRGQNHDDLFFVKKPSNMKWWRLLFFRKKLLTIKRGQLLFFRKTVDTEMMTTFVFIVKNVEDKKTTTSVLSKKASMTTGVWCEKKQMTKWWRPPVSLCHRFSKWYFETLWAKSKYKSMKYTGTKHEGNPHPYLLKIKEECNLQIRKDSWSLYVLKTKRTATNGLPPPFFFPTKKRAKILRQLEFCLTILPGDTWRQK